MADHFIKATRYHKDGSILVTYWCEKKDTVPADEPFDVDEATSRRRKADCAKCRKASGWSAPAQVLTARPEAAPAPNRLR